MKIENLLWTAAPSLHMMSKNQLPFGGKDTIWRSTEPTVITTASGMAESTEEATVYVNHLDACVTMVLREDSHEGYLCVYRAKKWATLLHGQRTSVHR